MQFFRVSVTPDSWHSHDIIRQPLQYTDDLLHLGPVMTQSWHHDIINLYNTQMIYFTLAHSWHSHDIIRQPLQYTDDLLYLGPFRHSHDIIRQPLQYMADPFYLGIFKTQSTWVKTSSISIIVIHSWSSLPRSYRDTVMTSANNHYNTLLIFI